MQASLHLDKRYNLVLTYYGEQISQKEAVGIYVDVMASLYNFLPVLLVQHSNSSCPMRWARCSSGSSTLRIMLT